MAARQDGAAHQIALKSKGSDVSAVLIGLSAPCHEKLLDAIWFAVVRTFMQHDIRRILEPR